MKISLCPAAGAALLTATMAATIAMAEPGNGNSANGKDRPDHPGGNENSASKGENADANPAADLGNLPGYPAGAAGIALFQELRQESDGARKYTVGTLTAGGKTLHALLTGAPAASIAPPPL
jgi:hypothetical protein